MRRSLAKFSESDVSNRTPSSVDFTTTTPDLKFSVPIRRIFPQIVGLGFSATAQRFAIGSRAEAAAYLEHGVLGPRLVECTRLVVAASDRSITAILGSPDDMKFRS